MEQKNWAVLRRLIGYDRYHSPQALHQLNRLYPLVTSYVSFFQPVMQVQEKRRQGAWSHKVYDVPRTPYHRLLKQGVLPAERKERLLAEYQRLNSVNLLKEINRELERMWQLTHTQPRSTAQSNTNFGALYCLWVTVSFEAIRVVAASRNGSYPCGSLCPLAKATTGYQTSTIDRVIRSPC